MCVTIQCVCYQKMRNFKEKKKESAYSVCVIAADEQSPSRGLQLSSGSMNATDQMYSPRERVIDMRTRKTPGVVDCTWSAGMSWNTVARHAAPVMTHASWRASPSVSSPPSSSSLPSSCSPTRQLSSARLVVHPTKEAQEKSHGASSSSPPFL